MTSNCNCLTLNRMGIGILKENYDTPEDVDKYLVAVVAKVIDDRVFSEVQLQTWVDNYWKTDRAILVKKTSHEKNLFFFFCTSWEDRDNLMSMVSTSYKRALVIFKGWLMESNVMEMDFSESSLWVKVGLPTTECQPQMARRILDEWVEL
uniref:DUF4283 domain-containing protein n=1 Tax=Chenopodium quinoa TaxID=63459 RepID=A0A803MDR2_CHEQI